MENTATDGAQRELARLSLALAIVRGQGKKGLGDRGAGKLLADDQAKQAAGLALGILFPRESAIESAVCLRSASSRADLEAALGLLSRALPAEAALAAAEIRSLWSLRDADRPFRAGSASSAPPCAAVASLSAFCAQALLALGGKCQAPRARRAGGEPSPPEDLTVEETCGHDGPLLGIMARAALLSAASGRSPLRLSAIPDEDALTGLLPHPSEPPEGPEGVWRIWLLRALAEFQAQGRDAGLSGGALLAPWFPEDIERARELGILRLR